MSKTFKQKEWGTIHGISMSASGCGPCSIAAIVANLVKDITQKRLPSGSTQTAISFHPEQPVPV